jgi:RES domain-containing protein
VRIWRITSSEYISTVFSGKGGLYASGRWHPKGNKISYTSESLALASLEVFVGIETADIPLGCVSAIIPDTTPILEITKDILPANWQDVSAYSDLQEIGLKWLQAMEYPVLKVPSAIIPVEYNYLINPEHPDLQLQTEQVLEFQFDRRMWKQRKQDN